MSLEVTSVSDIKRKINEIAFQPLSDHGNLFAEVNRELNEALASVEGLSASN
jgi:hypothetical protein